MTNLPDISALSPTRKNERQKIIAAFTDVAKTYGATVEVKETPRKYTDVSFSLNGVGGRLSLWHTNRKYANGTPKPFVISWYSAFDLGGLPKGFHRAVNADLTNTHKATSVGYLLELIHYVDSGLDLVKHREQSA